MQANTNVNKVMLQAALAKDKKAIDLTNLRQAIYSLKYTVLMAHKTPKKLAV